MKLYKINNKIYNNDLKEVVIIDSVKLSIKENTEISISTLNTKLNPSDLIDLLKNYHTTIKDFNSLKYEDEGVIDCIRFENNEIVEYFSFEYIVNREGDFFITYFDNNEFINYYLEYNTGDFNYISDTNEVIYISINNRIKFYKINLSE